MGGSMKRQSLSLRGRESGAALIVVLSLLAISLMVGLSSMQSSQVDERLSGNYRAQSDAQMAAEKAVSDGLRFLQASSNPLGDFTETLLKVSDIEDMSFQEFLSSSSFSGAPLVGDQCNDDMVSCYYRLIKDDSGDNYVVGIGVVDDGAVAVSEPVFARIIYSPGGGLLIGAEAALTCSGSCGFFAKNPPTVIDGRDYKASVDTRGSIKDSDLNPDGQDSAAYIVPEGNVELGKASVTGDGIENAAGYDDMDGRLSEVWYDADDVENSAKVRIESDIARLIDMGRDGHELITYWGPGSTGTFSMPTSGIVVVDSVDMAMDVPGNFKFTGLIVVKDANFDLRPSRGAGTVSVVGAILAQDANVDMQNGNPSLLYSTEALCLVGAIPCTGGPGGGGGAGDGTLRVDRWF